MNRDFKGVWIPKEIWLNKELTMLEKVLLTEINSLDAENHCIAGNEYFAEFCNCSESAISKAIKHLQELEMIEILSFDGRHRKIAISSRLVNFTRQDSKIYETESENLLSSNINNNKIKKSLIDKSIKDRGEIPKLDFIKLYNEICTNLPKCVKISDKRSKAINKLINKYSADEIQAVLEKANNSDFLTGKNDRGWKADIDFILREDKFINILEDKYGGKQRISTKAGSDIGQHLNRVGDKQKFREDIANGKAEKF